MKAKYGFFTSEVAIPPFLSQKEVQEDCQAGLITDVHQRGSKGFYLIPHYSVEEYYKSKKLPERIIKEHLLKLKIVPEADRENLAHQILSRKIANGQQLDLISLLG